MRAGVIFRGFLVVFALVQLFVFLRLWDDVNDLLKWGVCGISPCHVCPCPPFTWFGPHPNPHCPEDPAAIFPPVTLQEVQTAGFLATSSLEFCEANPFTRYLVDAASPGGLSMMYWEADIKTEQFFRALYFSASCLTRVATKWQKFDLFNKTLECPSLQRYPNYDYDGTKYLCALKELKPPCVIYSLGSKNNYLFEDNMLQRTECEIHTFDCTVEPAKYKNPKIIFHKVCIGAKTEMIDGKRYVAFSELTKELGHERVDLLKMDIEGYEYTVFQDWLPSHTNLPYQIVFEMHLNFLIAHEAVMMMSNLFAMGYRVVSRDDNFRYWEGTELTLVRTKCPKPKTLGTQ